MPSSTPWRGSRCVEKEREKGESFLGVALVFFFGRRWISIDVGGRQGLVVLRKRSMLCCGRLIEKQCLV